MKVQSCQSSGMEVSPETYNACTFEIIDKWDPTQHAKTCDTMFYLRDGTGAYVWDCDKWIFLDFTGYTAPNWEAKPEEAGYIENKPFEILGNGFVLDENGVLSVSEDAFAQADWSVTESTDPSFIKNKPMIPKSVNQQAFGPDGNAYIDGTNIPVGGGDDRTIKEAIEAIPDDQVQSDWNTTNTADPAYIKNKPTIPAEQIQSDWNQTSTTAKDFIKNKPAIPAEQVQSDWNVTDTNNKAFIKNKPVIPEGAVLYPATGQNTNGAMTQKAVTDELLKRFTDKGVLPKPTDMNTLTEAGSYSMSNFIAGTDVTNHPPLAVDSGGKCYALILVFKNSDRPVTTQFWFTSSASTPKPTFFFRTQAQSPLVWSEWEALDNQAPDLSGYVTLDTAQTITGKKVFTGLTDFKSVVSGNLQVVQRFILANEAGDSMQTQGAFYMNPRLAGQTSNGFGVGMGWGGLAVVGGGEAHRGFLEAIEKPETRPAVIPANINGGSEHLVLVADSEIYIGTGYQSAGKTGYWWKFSSTGKAFSPSGAEILDKTYGDKLYVSLTEVNHVLGETTFDSVKASSDTDGWVTITDRKNGFTGGTVKYKRHMNVVTIQGDNITCPALAQFSPTVICNIPDGARITDGKPNGAGHVSNVAMGFHAETNGDVYIHNSAALTTKMHVNFTFTYVV